MTNANDLPQDIWELIAFYLTWRIRRSLIGLNRQMFNIVLGERYRTATWVDPDPFTFNRLKHLCVPQTASHVRCLHISAWFMRRLLDLPLDSLHGNTRRSGGTTSYNPLKKLGELIYGNAYAAAGNMKTSEPKSPIKSRCIPGTDEDLDWALDAMRESMGLMVNLREFHIEWRNLPLTASAKAFLRSVNDAFTDNLVKLVLAGTSTRIVAMMSGLITPPNLEELDLQIDFNPKDPKADVHNETLFSGIMAPYINGLKATLRTLKIISWASGDHSGLFQALETLPMLRVFALRISFETEQLSDSSSLLTFLQAHIFQLHRLELMPHRTDTGTICENWAGFHQKLVAIDPWFPNLNSVWITSPTPNAVHTLIQHVPSAMTSLRLAHRYYKPSEAMAIAKAISSQVHLLDTFSFYVNTMTYELLNSLAASLPALRSLTLVVEIESHPFVNEMDPIENPDWCPKPIDWNLSDLGIYIKNYRENSLSRQDVYEDSEHALMKVVQRVIPSITSFKGRGHASLHHVWAFSRNTRVWHMSDPNQH